MIRTLAIITVVGFFLSIGCLIASFAIAGGPFYIDDDFRFHGGGWTADRTDGHSKPTISINID